MVQLEVFVLFLRGTIKLSLFRSLVCLIRLSTQISHKLHNIQIWATVDYGANDRESKELLWDDLHHRSKFLNYYDPCVILGDFNIVKEAYEREGGLGINRGAY